MTLASASALPSMTAVAPPPASAAGPASPPADEGGFARALQQARHGRREGASTDKPPSPPSKSTGSTRETADAEGSAAPETVGGPDGSTRTSGDTDAAAGPQTGRADKTPADAAAPEDALLPPWMTAALPPTPAEPLPETGDCRLPADAEAVSTPAPGGKPSDPATKGTDLTDDLARGGEVDAARWSGTDDRRVDDDGGRIDDAGADFRDKLAAAAPSSSPTATPTALAAGGVTAHAGTPGTAAPVAEHTLRPPLHSPAFAPALGAQLTLMVKEGVTEARLHLNPAEMGPISVQIQVEGGHARVEMAAEMAATRQVLEQSMPALAGALRESGLTLTGGGVFEQSARQGQSGDAERRPGSQATSGRPGTGDGPGGPVEAGAGARAAGVARGVVDVYA